MSYIDWQPSDDPLLRGSEVEAHEALHQQRADKRQNASALLQNPRLAVFPQAERIVGTRICGRVLDVGCGNGYASSWLALNRPVEEIYALEATHSAVESLIPSTLSHLNVPAGIVKPTLGSFNQIPVTSFFDFVVAMGALHHSTNLLRTLQECAKALKPGGFLIAQEPASEDSATNEEFLARYTAFEAFYGQHIQAGSRDDHFFRQCEYKTALHHAGLDVLHFKPFRPLGQPIHFLKLLRLQWMRKRRAHQLRAAGHPTLKPPTPYLLIARKPKEPLAYVPHDWCASSVSPS